MVGAVFSPSPCSPRARRLAARGQLHGPLVILHRHAADRQSDDGEKEASTSAGLIASEKTTFTQLSPIDDAEETDGRARPRRHPSGDRW